MCYYCLNCFIRFHKLALTDSSTLCIAVNNMFYESFNVTEMIFVNNPRYPVQQHLYEGFLSIAINIVNEPFAYHAKLLIQFKSWKSLDTQFSYSLYYLYYLYYRNLDLLLYNNVHGITGKFPSYIQVMKNYYKNSPSDEEFIRFHN